MQLQRMCFFNKSLCIALRVTSLELLLARASQCCFAPVHFHDYAPFWCANIMNLKWKITGFILPNINISKLFCTTDHFVWTCHLVALRIFFRRWYSSYLASCLSIVTSYLSPVLFGVCNEVQHKRTQFRVNEEGGTKNPKAMWHFSSIHSMHVSSVDTLWSVVVFFRIFSINAFHFIYFYRSFCSLHSWCELLPYPLQIFRLNDQRCNFFSRFFLSSVSCWCFAFCLP